MENIIVKISGNSMSPVLFPNKEYIFTDDVSELKRNDIVILGMHKNFAKFVKGIPGDVIEYKKYSLSFWNIFINDEILSISTGQPYVLDNKRKTFLEAYGKIIPEDSYLCLGNIASGSLDSTKYGLFTKDYIIAKKE